MATATWQTILERGQQTLAVWQQHSPSFSLRGLTWAEHGSAVAGLAPAGQRVAEAQDAADDARAARDAAVEPVRELSVRVPRRLDGDLAPDDPFHGDLEDIRSVPADSLVNVQARGQRVLSLWKKLDARNAATAPAIPALTVGGVALATFQAQLESLPAKAQAVQDKDAILRDRRSALRLLAARVDQHNKRWYAAWQGEFPTGTPEGDALGQITTETGGSNPPPVAPLPVGTGLPGAVAERGGA